jgi:hypothetical protein
MGVKSVPGVIHIVDGGQKLLQLNKLSRDMRPFLHTFSTVGKWIAATMDPPAGDRAECTLLND